MGGIWNSFSALDAGRWWFSLKALSILPTFSHLPLGLRDLRRSCTVSFTRNLRYCLWSYLQRGLFRRNCCIPPSRCFSLDLPNCRTQNKTWHYCAIGFGWQLLKDGEQKPSNFWGSLWLYLDPCSYDWSKNRLKCIGALFHLIFSWLIHNFSCR